MKEKLKGQIKKRIKDPGRRLIARHIWRERSLFVLAIALTFGGALTEGLGIGLLVPFIESLTSPESDPLRTGIEFVDVYVLAVEADTSTRLFWVSGLILALVGLRAALGYGAAVTSVRLTERITAKLRREVIDQVQSVSLRYFAKTRTGDILNTLTKEVQRVNRLFQTSHTILARSSMALLYGSAIFVLSWPLALIAIVLSLALFLVMNGFIGYLRRYGRLIPEANAEVTSIATELISGIRTVTISGTKDQEAGRFRKATDRARDLSIELRSKSELIDPIQQFMSSTALIAIVIVAVWFFILPGDMTAAILLTFLFVLFRLVPKIKSLNGLRGQWAEQRGSLENLANFLLDDDKPYLPDGTRAFTQLESGIELQNVWFAYHDNEMVLKDISFRIEHGESVAFVGASGAGKSTLADLIIRLYDPVEGRILLDGHDLRDYQIQSLRENIAMVSQDTFLFNNTVRYNLTYGAEGNISDAQLRWAAEQANALDFIENLEEGFDTMLGDRGTRLSGGQRQRIAIARAILQAPELLVLDEATSDLDSISERLIQEAMEQLMEDRTVVVIAHRLSTIEHADKVVVIEDGEIVEQGQYQELIERRGQLWEYHRTQYRHEKVEA